MIMLTDMYTGKVRPSLIEDSAFQDAIEGLQSFVLDTGADSDMAYDWVCDQANVASFVADTPAWDLFFKSFLDAARDSI